MKRRTFAYPYILWMLLLIVAPMLLIIYYAFTGKIDGNTVFTLDTLKKALEPLYLRVLLDSLLISLAATVMCLLIGYPVAYIISRMPMNRANTLSVFFVLPMWMNFLLRTYAWMALLDVNGIINRFLVSIGFARARLLYTQGAVMLGMIYNFLPFMILPIYSVLVKIQKSHIEAAQDLGASSRQVFGRIIFPLSISGVVSGITMVFIPSITTFAISQLLGGSHFMLYGDLIENQFIQMSDWHFGSALSFIMLVLVLISMFIMRRYDKDDVGGKLW